MDWLNYHHLLYFWTIAKEGSVSGAAKRLHLAQPTLSNQIKKLETSIGAKLFRRSGRSIQLTDTGQMVFKYADEMFTIGRELTDALRGQPSPNKTTLSVGVPDALPKLVVYRLLKPALSIPMKVQLVCHEGKLPDLLSRLALHELDLVLSDTTITPQIHVRAFNHKLGECSVSVFGTPALVKKYQKGFPRSLHGAPMLLPTQNTTLRRAMELWFEQNEVRPMIIHEFEDSGVLKVFGQEGEGLFVAPSAIEQEICQQYAVSVAGQITEVTETFYAISVERRLKHPAVLALTNAAREILFVNNK